MNPGIAFLRSMGLTVALVVVITGSAAAGWLIDWRLTDDPGASFTSGNNARCIACDAVGDAHVVWSDGRDGNFEIYYKRYDGQDWTGAVRLTDDVGCSADPAIAVDTNGLVHVVWRDDRDGTYEIYHKVFDGMTWSGDERLSADGNLSWAPSMAAGPGGDVHVVWHDDRNRDTEVYYKYHDGVSWGPDTRLTDALGKSQYPSLGVDDSGHVHVVWQDYRDNCWEVYYKKYDGSVWGPDERLTHTGTGLYPCVAADGEGRVHVVWEDHWDGAYDIYYKCFDGGWSLIERLTDVAASSRNPSVAVGDSGRIHVVWQDYRHGEREVYHKTHDGIAWGPDERLTDAAGISADPSVVADLVGEVHVVWHDYRDGNAEIYWKRSYDGAVIKPEVVSIEPDSGLTLSEVEITDLAGAGFATPVHVWLQKAGEVDIIGYDIEVISENRITCSVYLSKVSGDWDVVVQNPTGLMDTLIAGFTVVRRHKPVIDSLYPATWWSGESVFDVHIWGGYFSDSASVRLAKIGEPDLNASNVVVASPESLSYDIDLSGAAVGAWDVVVENVDGQCDTLGSGFGVIAPEKPAIDSILPAEWRSDEGAHGINLWGSHFSNHAVVLLVKIGETDLIASNVVVASPESLSFSVDLTGAAVGARDVVIENADGQRDTLVAGFEVLTSLWADEVRLTDTTGISLIGESHAKCLAVGSDGSRHVVWYDDRDGNWEIYYKSHDGIDWSEDIRLTDAGGVSERPALALDAAGNVHVAWSDNRDGNWEIYYKKHDGTSWGIDERLTTDADDSRYVAIAAAGAGIVHVVWQNYKAVGNAFSIRYAAFDGVSWSSPETVSDDDGAGMPSVAVDGSGHVHVAWYDEPEDGNNEIYYRKHDGAGWLGIVRLTDNQDEDWSPCIAAAADGRAHVVWHSESPGNYEIMYKSCDGLSWGEVVRLTEATGISANASIALGPEGSVGVAWRDERDGDKEIYFKGFDGSEWGRDLRLTSAAGDSRKPSIAAQATGELHVVWYDERHGAAEIYYRMKTSAGYAGVAEDIVDVATGLAAGKVIPNPVRRSCEIRFRAPGIGGFRISVYDVSGRLIWQTAGAPTASDTVHCYWNGCDANGRRVPSGVYFARLKFGRLTSTTKLIVIR
jgi:hypothetical protein